MYTDITISIILIICLVLYIANLKQKKEQFSNNPTKLTNKELIQFAKEQLGSADHKLAIQNKNKKEETIETQLLKNSQKINQKIYSQNLALANINNELNKLIETHKPIHKPIHKHKPTNISIETPVDNVNRCV